MFDFLKGVLNFVNKDSLSIDCCGHGYKIFIAKHRLSDAKSIIGKNIFLYTETIIRENEYSIYGFLYEIERDIFNALRSVKGIGPKIALNILGSITIEEINYAVINSDNKFFLKINGIGEQTANRIILELKTFFQKSNFVNKNSVFDIQSQERAIQALISLGYKRALAEKAVNLAKNKCSENKMEELIKIAIKCTQV